MPTGGTLEQADGTAWMAFYSQTMLQLATELALNDPAYEELAFLTDTLPSKERAAVVLRYGYDLDYEQIAAALDSSAEAARQATSSGVRRLRRRIT